MDSDLNLQFDQLDDEKLIEQIENAAEIKDLETHKGWKLLNEACKRAAFQAGEALADVDPKDEVLIVKYQQIKKLYGHVIPSLINSFKQEGDLAFQESKNRGLLDRLLSRVRA